MVEEQVCHFIKQQNRPYNTQLVADNLAQFGLKKGPIQKALDCLSEAGKIRCKEFGKTKIYIAIQDQAEVLDKEEMERKSAQAATLTEKVKTDGEAIKELRKAVRDAKSTMTLEELDASLTNLQGKVTEQGSKLKTLQSGAVLVPPEKRDSAEKAFADAMAQWAKRKRIFKNIWNAISENVEDKQSDLFEEIGVELDEGLAADFKSLEQLLPKKRRIV